MTMASHSTSLLIPDSGRTLAPPSERLPTQLYGTPPAAACVLGHDPLSEEGR